MSVHAVAVSSRHDFTKPTVKSIKLLKGLGVEGDCHLGVNVQHRSRLQVRTRPANLHQVHLIPLEIISPLAVKPGQIGENITIIDSNLLSLGRGTKLHFLRADDEFALDSAHAIVVVQGLRNPCPQIDKFRTGLREEFLTRDAERNIIAPTAGVMGTVEAGGPIHAGMAIYIEDPAVYESLQCV